MQTFRKTLPAVRRALANVPTYMILDDHEVTDDFNMTRRFVDQVYADDLGLRVVQNGLTAFAVCQAWGNIPEQFDPGTPAAAGSQLLAQLAGVAGATDNPRSLREGVAHDHAAGRSAQARRHERWHRRIDARVPRGTAADTVTVNGVDVNTKALRYNFTVEGPSHQVLVTDTRTWRGFAGHNELPTLLYKQLDDQIVNANRRSAIACSSSCAPRTRPRLPRSGCSFMLAEQQWLSYRMAASSDESPHSAIDYWDIYDSWDFPAGISTS